jgi:hypothetical protein
MNATDLILTAQSEGLILSLSDSGAIKYVGDPAAVNRWLPAITKHKTEILGALEGRTEPRLSSPSIPAREEQSIREWLATIGENDTAVIDEVLAKCRQDSDALRYFVGRAKPEPLETALFDQEAFEERAGICEFDGGLSRDEAEAIAWNENDRRRCVHCLNLAENGICLAASPGGPVSARRGYQPNPAILQRCAGYRPVQDDPDRRPGRERWPEFGNP